MKKIDELSNDIISRLPELDPKKINLWLNSVLWEVRGTQQDIQNSTLVRLYEYLYEVFGIFAPDHVRAVYELLLRIVLQAASAKVHKPFTEKKILFQQLSSEVRAKANELLRPYAAGDGPPLRHALVRLGLPDIDVQQILLEYKACKSEFWQQSYLKLKDPDGIEKAVEDCLHDLRLQYVSGILQDTPLEFHGRCRRELEALHAAMDPAIRPPLKYLRCLMYERVRRKLHSFQKDGS